MVKGVGDMRNMIHIGMIPEPVQKTTLHGHPIWEIVYYTHGSGTLTANKENIEFRAKTIICIPPGTLHSEYSTAGFRNIHMLVQSFDGFPAPLHCFTDTEDGVFDLILTLVYKEFHKKQHNWRSITESLLQVLHQYLLAWHGKRKSPLVEKVENMMVAHLSDKSFSIRDTLKTIRVSEDHFRRLFKLETGKTPLQYLTEKRIDYAKRILENDRVHAEKIADVAEMVGFEDPLYFSRVFRKMTETSPTQ